MEVRKGERGEGIVVCVCVWGGNSSTSQKDKIHSFSLNGLSQPLEDKRKTKSRDREQRNSLGSQSCLRL